MDTNFLRLRYRISRAWHNLSQSLSFRHKHARAVSGSITSIDVGHSSLADGLSPTIKKIDFVAGATAFKRSRIKHSLLNGMIKLFVTVLIIAVILVAIGVALNVKYSGRALPFTHIGGVSVGGMSEVEIKQALDARVSELTVSFVDGGLVKTVPLKAFTASVDTESASKMAVSGHFNPLKFLDRRKIDPKIAINERQLAGYLRLNVDSTKTVSEDASLVISRGKLQIQPETVGYRTDVHYIATGILESLKKLEDTTVNVNTMTIKPQVYAVDLQDELTHANAMVNTDVSLAYGWATVKPTLAQKLAWLQISRVPGTTNTKVDFSRPAIREYVIGLSKKYRVDPKAETKTTLPDGTVKVEPGQFGKSIQNVDEATDAIISSLSNTKSNKITLISSPIAYQKLDPTVNQVAVVPAAATKPTTN